MLRKCVNHDIRNSSWIEQSMGKQTGAVRTVTYIVDVARRGT